VELAPLAVMQALVLSSMYVLVALGFALLFSIRGILNFAHGAIYMISGYICYELAVVYGVNQWASLILSVLIVGLIGIFLERVCFRPLYGDMMRTIVMAIAIILILETAVNVSVGAYTRALPSFAPGVLHFGTASVSLERAVTFAIGGLLLLGMSLFIRKSKMGQQMLAISQDMEGATLQGIDINRVSSFTCFLGCALAAVAGCLLGAVLSLSPFMGDQMLIKAIELVILGGMGSIGGVFIAGLIIGTIDSTLRIFASVGLTQVVGIGIIIVLLVFRPQGLFGREV
jgi:branched-chain amino acid transport system permease protein